ncbi:MAG: protein TolQ [Deltaproteobacteria bacterium]|nr:protein TolQ [Deltaproteobacteria bacterium]
MGSTDTEILHLIINAGLMVRFVLLALLTFSVGCWTVIFTKGLQLRKARLENAQFLEAFWENRDLGKVSALAKRYPNSPVARVFHAAYKEFTRSTQIQTDAASAADGGGARLDVTENVERTLRRAMQTETTRLSQWVPFLATTGNTAPFIGLFGTVWGIMNSFRGIGASGSASLAVVAPGISEALIATAAGLAAAIPAVIAFNHFLSKIRVVESDMRAFSSDLLNLLERNLAKNPGAGQ